MTRLALENQLDLFVHVFNFKKLFPGKRMNVPKKLHIAAKCGILEGRTFERINRLRNLVEHQYKVPSINDIEAFYDLIVSATSLLQQGMLLALVSNTDYGIYQSNETIGNFNISYDFNNARASANWTLKGENKAVSFSQEDADSALYIIRVSYYLRQLNVSSSTKYIRGKLGLAANGL